MCLILCVVALVFCIELKIQKQYSFVYINTKLDLVDSIYISIIGLQYMDIFQHLCLVFNL